MTIYTHKHHIVPKHMGGTDEESNLIELTVEQHAQEHWELYCMHGLTEDYIAYLGLSGQISSDEARRLSVSNALKGKPKSQEHKQNISKSIKAKIQSRGKSMTEGMKLPPASDERKRKISEANMGHKRNLGRTHSQETIKKMKSVVRSKATCPNCNKTMLIPNLVRYHGLDGTRCKN